MIANLLYTVASGNSVSRNSVISRCSGYVQLTDCLFCLYLSRNSGFSCNSGHFEDDGHVHYYQRQLYCLWKNFCEKEDIFRFWFQFLFHTLLILVSYPRFILGEAHSVTIANYFLACGAKLLIIKFKTTSIHVVLSEAYPSCVWPVLQLGCTCEAGTS